MKKGYLNISALYNKDTKRWHGNTGCRECSKKRKSQNYAEKNPQENSTNSGQLQTAVKVKAKNQFPTRQAATLPAAY